MSGRANVDRGLYLSALRDAIEWQQTFLWSHDPATGTVTSCCKPGARCEAYEKATEQLVRYRRAYTRAGGRPDGEMMTVKQALARLG